MQEQNARLSNAANLPPIGIVLEHASLDHDLHPIHRDAGPFVHGLLESCAGLSGVQLEDIINLASMLNAHKNHLEWAVGGWGEQFNVLGVTRRAAENSRND